MSSHNSTMRWVLISFNLKMGKTGTERSTGLNKVAQSCTNPRQDLNPSRVDESTTPHIASQGQLRRRKHKYHLFAFLWIESRNVFLIRIKGLHYKKDDFRVITGGKNCWLFGF